MNVPNRPVTLVALTLWAIGSVVLAYAGNGIGAKRPTANQARTAERLGPPKELEALALKAIARQYNLLLADLEIDNSWIFTYEYTGQRANVYSVTDNHSDKAYQIAFDDNGHVLDLAKLSADDLATKAARYGKLSPYLFEYLKQAPPDQEIGVSIYLNLGPDTADQPKDDPPMDSEKLKQMSPQERQDYDQKALDFERRLKAYNAARAQRVGDPVVQRLKEMGYHAEVLGSTGFISLKLRPAMIKEVETWREVREISSAPNDKPSSGSRSPKSPTATMLDVSRPLIGADVVENRGINGQNITIGQVEVGGRVLNAAGGNNPYLAGLSQDNSFICANPSEHSVAVAGVMYSQATLPPVFRGISPGVHFLASGSCTGDLAQLDQSTRNLVNLGAVAVNHSHNGSDTGTAVTSNDQLYDAYVFTDHIGQVMSAGNDAGTPAQGCFGR
jgi:hypothetical protein